MTKIKLRFLATGVLATALLVGCGGGGGSGTPAEDISQNTSDLLAYVNRLITGTDDSSDPTDISALTLAVDDTGEPAAL